MTGSEFNRLLLGDGRGNSICFFRGIWMKPVCIMHHFAITDSHAADGIEDADIAHLLSEVGVSQPRFHIVVLIRNCIVADIYVR